MDIGVADESLNGIPYEESSESEEEEEAEEAEGEHRHLIRIEISTYFCVRLFSIIQEPTLSLYTRGCNVGFKIIFYLKIAFKDASLIEIKKKICRSKYKVVTLSI